MSSSSEAGDEYEQVTHDVTMDETEPPAKRLKLGDVGSATPSAVVAEADPDPEPEVETKADDFDDAMSISSDSSGDIPSSPANARLEDEDFQPQVTVCVWEDCDAGDLGTMDRLVKHIHDEHIEGRQKKYTCQWIGCSRQGANHASGYALKAHMRSHTREKPFFCYLPGKAHPCSTRRCKSRYDSDMRETECDKCFTRSDALAKHMRTVHETEALRPSDPVPKGLQSGGAAGKTPKLKIIIRTPQSHAAGQDDAVEDGHSGDENSAEHLTQLTEKDGFTSRELEMDWQKLHAVCRSQLQWAQEDAETLRRECDKWEDVVKKAWLEKEVLLDQTVKSELGWHERRQAILTGATDIVVNGGASEGVSAPAVPAITNGGAGAED